MEAIIEAVEEAQTGPLSVERSVRDVVGPHSDNLVTLPVGMFTPQEGVVDEAEIRELNGFDEEVIARSKNFGVTLSKVLERAVVRIGDEAATKKQLAWLTIGDRLELLLGIRKATWGDEVEFEMLCPECEQTVELTLSITRDIPRRELKDKAQGRSFMVDLPSGRTALCEWPTGSFHDKLLAGEFANAADLTTALLRNTVRSIDGMPLMSDDDAKALPLRDRQELRDKVMDELPGPLLTEVELTCPECNGAVPMPLQVGALFPL